jgi:hypothetical protein
MPVSIGTTFWRCPVCKHKSIVDGGDLATIGIPFCGECEREQELEQLPSPVATVVFLDDGENYPQYIGVALRPKGTNAKRFQAKIARLYRDWLQTANPPFSLWLERRHRITFLDAHRIDVAVHDDEDTA